MKCIECLQLHCDTDTGYENEWRHLHMHFKITRSGFLHFPVLPCTWIWWFRECFWWFFNGGYQYFFIIQHIPQGPCTGVAVISYYRRESTFYRDSTSLQRIRICNSVQTKSDVNSISLVEIRRKPVLCGEQARTQFLFPFTNKMRLP